MPDGDLRSDCDSVNGADVVYLFESGIADSEGSDVERLNQHAFYELGRHLRQLAKYEGEVPRQVPLFDLWTAQGVLGQLMDGVPIPISVSRPAANELLGQINQIINAHYYVPGEDGKPTFAFPSPEAPPIAGFWWDTYRQNLAKFETIFSAEMTETTTYWVPRRGIYFVPALVDAAEQTFPADILGQVPEKTKVDWRAAGRCLAFSLHTASGFHAARAVEGTLEAYYQTFTGNAGKTLRSWDDYIKALTKVSESGACPSPTPKTLSELDQMRTYDRNPIMHPRVVLSESEARIMFSSSESLILAMAQELKAARDVGGVQTVLSVVGGDANSAG